MLSPLPRGPYNPSPFLIYFAGDDRNSDWSIITCPCLVLWPIHHWVLLLCLTCNPNGPVLGLFQGGNLGEEDSVLPLFWDGNPLKRWLPLSFLSSLPCIYFFLCFFGPLWRTAIALSIAIIMSLYSNMENLWAQLGGSTLFFFNCHKGMRMRNKPVKWYLRI